MLPNTEDVLLTQTESIAVDGGSFFENVCDFFQDRSDGGELGFSEPLAELLLAI